MRVRFQTLFNLGIFVLLTVLVGAVWCSAQTTNAAPTAPVVQTTNAPPTVEEDTEFFQSFTLDRVEPLRAHLFHNPIWKYLAFLVYVGMAWVLAKAINHLFLVGMKRRAEKASSEFQLLYLELLRGPIKVISFVILLHVVLNIFTWPEWVKLYLSKGLKLAVAWSVTYMAIKAVEVLLRQMQNRAQAEERPFDAQLFPVIRKTLQIFIVLVAILVTAQNLEFNITSLLASLSIGGLAVGLAAQDTLANLFGAVAIFIDKPFLVGDIIKLEAIEGNVERIGLRSTRVRNADGHLVTIPNKTMAGATVTNVSRRPGIHTVMNLSIAQDTPAEKIEEALAILNEIFRPHPMTASVSIWFNKFAESALNLQVDHFWKGQDWSAYQAGLQAFNLTIKRRFEKAGIPFAFPTRTLYLKSALPAQTETKTL